MQKSYIKCEKVMNFIITISFLTFLIPGMYFGFVTHYFLFIVLFVIPILWALTFPLSFVKSFYFNMNTGYLFFVIRQDEKVQMAMFGRSLDVNGFWLTALVKIRKPCRKLQEIIVNNYPSNISYLRYMDLDLQLRMVNFAHMYIYHIKNPTKEAQVQAIINSKFDEEVIEYCSGFSEYIEYKEEIEKLKVVYGILL